MSLPLTPSQRAAVKARSSRAFIAAESKLALWAVCLVGWTEPGPARFGDNRGSWPVRIAITGKKPEHAAKDDDRFSPHMPVAVLEHVYVQTEAHAKRLKDALEAILFGQEQSAGSPECRGAYFNARAFFECETTRALWWSTVLQEAQQRMLERATSFEMITESDKAKRLTRVVAGGVR